MHVHNSILDFIKKIEIKKGSRDRNEIIKSKETSS